MAKEKEYLDIAQNTWDGMFFKGDGTKDKCMIVFSGSEGGLEHAGKISRFLSDNGVPALAFSLFRTKHSPKALNLIPLEQIRSAIDYIKNKGYAKIGVLGVSRGSEYALAAAIEYPDISFVVIRTPSWFYGEGLRNHHPTGHSTWTKDGKELPYTPLRSRKYNILKQIIKKKEFNILEWYTGLDILEESVIPVEKVKGPVLIQSVHLDTIWPSEKNAEKIEKRLKEKGFQYPHKHTCYPHMSHVMMEYCGPQIKYFVKSEKQYPEECAEERRLMGEETLEWIKNQW